jgi:hypothetical protein
VQENKSLAGVNFSGLDLGGVNLTGMDLTDADLTDAYLEDVLLAGANLKNAKLPSAPAVEGLHQKMLAAIEANPNVFSMRTWHSGYDGYNPNTCTTSHCRAGWAIHLAGSDGDKLEENIGSDAAGALITMASCPWLEKVPDWYASDEEALADIRRCAEIERTMSAGRQEKP